MSRSFHTSVLAGLALLAIGVGVAVADSGYGETHGPSSPAAQRQNPGQPAPASGKQRQVFKRLTSSRLAQVAYLTGQAEVHDDGQDDAGDPDAKGSASLLQVDERTVCYGFMLKGADAPTQVHIHRGAAGINGPPVLEFANVPKDDAGNPAGNPGTSSGCKTLQTPAEMEVLRRIRLNPKNYYVNFHTQTFPKGAVRGQLGPVWYSNDD